MSYNIFIKKDLREKSRILELLRKRRFRMLLFYNWHILLVYIASLWGFVVVINRLSTRQVGQKLEFYYIFNTLKATLLKQFDFISVCVCKGYR
jgi:hypothetical protein